MASLNRHNSQCCRWPAAIPLSLPICREALAVRSGRQTEKHRVHKRYERGGPCETGKEKSEEQSKNLAASETRPRSPPQQGYGGNVAATRQRAATDEHESDVRVITRAVYRQDNEGYIDPKHPAHIWIVTAPRSAEEKVKPRQLTTGRFDEDNAIWSKDGSQIYFTSSRIDEPYYELPRTDLYSVPAAGGKPYQDHNDRSQHAIRTGRRRVVSQSRRQTGRIRRRDQPADQLIYGARSVGPRSLAERKTTEHHREF